MARLYGPAVRYKPDVNKWRVVLRFCIRPLHGAIVLLAIMDNGSLMGHSDVLLVLLTPPSFSEPFGAGARPVHPIMRH